MEEWVCFRGYAKLNWVDWYCFTCNVYPTILGMKSKVRGNSLSVVRLTREYTIFQNQTLRSITLHINCISQYKIMGKILRGLSDERRRSAPCDPYSPQIPSYSESCGQPWADIVDSLLKIAGGRGSQQGWLFKCIIKRWENSVFKVCWASANRGFQDPV